MSRKLKICARCPREFEPRDNRQLLCGREECRREHHRELCRRWDAKRLRSEESYAKLKATVRARYHLLKSDPDFKRKRNEAAKHYRERPEVKERAKQYQADNRERINARHKLWLAKNPQARPRYRVRRKIKHRAAWEILSELAKTDPKLRSIIGELNDLA